MHTGPQGLPANAHGGWAATACCNCKRLCNNCQRRRNRAQGAWYKQRSHGSTPLYIALEAARTICSQVLPASAKQTLHATAKGGVAATPGVIAGDEEAEADDASGDAAGTSSAQRGHARRHSVSHLPMQLRWKWCRHGSVVATSSSSKAARQTEQVWPHSCVPSIVGKLSMVGGLATGLETVSSNLRSVS